MHLKTVRTFKKNHQIPRFIWEKIFQEIRFSPSSFDLQPWRFFIIESQENKKKLKKCLKGNLQQWETSSAIVLLCGDLEKTKSAPYIYEQKYLRQHITKQNKEIILQRINDYYNDISMSRLKNEIFFEGGLIASHFILSSQMLNYYTCLMGGCHFELLNDLFEIPKKYLPIILIAIGKENAENNSKINNQLPFKLELKDFIKFL